MRDGCWHDGRSLGQKLGVSRAAVWKAITKLCNYGVAINRSQPKGCQLVAPLVLLEKESIDPQLDDPAIKLEVLETVSSTNDYLSRFSVGYGCAVCVAEHQRKGRGRFDRTWFSPFAQNIYASMAIDSPLALTALQGFSLVVGLSLCDALERATKLATHTLQLKWPNDLVVSAQKLAGVLVEIQAQQQGSCRIIMGMGVNVNMREVDSAGCQAIKQPWCSLSQCVGHSLDRNTLVASMVNTLRKDIALFEAFGMTPFMSRWQARDALYEQTIAVVYQGVVTTGVALGIDTYGQLQLRTPTGLQVFSSGEVSQVQKEGIAS